VLAFDGGPRATTVQTRRTMGNNIKDFVCWLPLLSVQLEVVFLSLVWNVFFEQGAAPKGLEALY
jgi:hypothetical protein